MKIVRKKGTFVPVVITLESEEEVEYLSKVVECDSDNSLEQFCEREKLNFDEINDFAFHFFGEMDNIYDENEDN